MIKKIDGLKNYGVDEKGNVYNISKNEPRKLKNYIMTNGYLGITISENGKRYKFMIHRLVAKAFIPNPNNYTDVDHIDFNRQNPCVENLQWCSRSENIKRSYDKGKIYQAWKPQLFMVKKQGIELFKKEGLLKICKELSKEYNIPYHSLVKYKKYGDIEIIKCND